jgi:hypothetical protein
MTVQIPLILEARIQEDGLLTQITNDVVVKELPSRYDGKASKHAVFSFNNSMFASPTTRTVWINGVAKEADLSVDGVVGLFTIKEPEY